jgi:predicted ATPase
VDLHLDGFHVLVGPNGSGKSTLLDVIAFIGDTLRVGPRAAVLGDLAAGVRTRASDARDLVWRRDAPYFELAIELAVPPRLDARVTGYETARYELSVAVGPEDGQISFQTETLWLVPARSSRSSRPLEEPFPSLRTPEHVVRLPNQKAPPGWRKVVKKIPEGGNDYFQSETSKWNNQFRLGPERSALGNLPEDEDKFPVATWVKRAFFDNLQRLVLEAERLRHPSPPGAPRAFQPDGSNLPWVAHELERVDPARVGRWVKDVATAVPELRSLRTVERQEDRHRYLLLGYGDEFEAPSWVVSDGTLRLLALTLLAHLPANEGLFLIEEPENGVHPRAVETLMAALSSVYDGQVLCASHSPVALQAVEPSQLLCFAVGSDGAADVVRGDEHPTLHKWQGEVDLGTLFAAGVLG